MPQSISDLLNEITVLENAVTKTASAKRGSSKIEQLASTVDKLADAMEEDEKDKEDKDHEKDESAAEEKAEEENKEASMKVTQELVDKIAAAVIGKLEKIAVLDASNTQKCEELGSAAPKAGNGGVLLDGANQIKDTHMIPGSKVESDSNSNSERLNISNTADLVKDAPPNSMDDPKKLQGGEKGASYIQYTQDEAEVLQKLASVGYEYLVEYHSDRIAREKIAAAVVAEQAKQAPTKIAQALLAQKTASVNPAMTAREKLAAAAQADPEVMAALQVLARKNVIN